MRKNAGTWGHITWFGTLLKLMPINMEGCGLARQGDLNSCCLVFLSDSVMRAGLDYFLLNGTTLHLRVKLVQASFRA